MSKFLNSLVCVVLCLFTLTACGSSSPKNDEVKDNDEPAITENSEVASDVYIAYTEVKSRFVTNITEKIAANDTINSDPEMLGITLQMVGFVSVDLIALPMSLCGLSEEDVQAGLLYLAAAGVKYDFKGDSCSLSYQDSSNVTTELISKFDDKTNSVTSVIKYDGSEDMFYEFTEIDGGYASQIYIKVDEGNYSLYRFILKGDNGIVGFEENLNSKPESIYKQNNISDDFCKDLPNWLELKDGQGSGLYAGKDITF